MDNALLIGLTRQQTLRRSLEITANNIANLSTNGFKMESLALEPARERPARHAIGPRPISFVDDWSVGRDFSEGPHQSTGNPLDLAIKGEGFFVVATPDGERYTRNGAFTLDDAGRLVTAAGDPVLDEAGGEIVLDPAGGAPTITADGSISDANGEVARVGLVTFADLGRLEKDGETLFRAPGADVRPEPVEAPSVRQGFVEGSNVRAVVEITKMIEVNRAYESASRMIRNLEDIKRDAIQKIVGGA
jgi:flagellar basal-body rod protein FlgF